MLSLKIERKKCPSNEEMWVVAAAVFVVVVSVKEYKGVGNTMSSLPRSPAPPSQTFEFNHQKQRCEAQNIKTTDTFTQRESAKKEVSDNEDKYNNNKQKYILTPKIART